MLFSQACSKSVPKPNGVLSCLNFLGKAHGRSFSVEKKDTIDKVSAAEFHRRIGELFVAYVTIAQGTDADTRKADIDFQDVCFEAHAKELGLDPSYFNRSPEERKTLMRVIGFAIGDHIHRRVGARSENYERFRFSWVVSLNLVQKR